MFSLYHPGVLFLVIEFPANSIWKYCFLRKKRLCQHDSVLILDTISKGLRCARRLQAEGTVSCYGLLCRLAYYQ